MSQDRGFSPRTRHVVLVQENEPDVNRPREAEEFDPIYFCTEHELPISPFLFLWINSNHIPIHQLILQPSCSSWGPAPPKAPAHLFPRMLGVGDTQQDAAHTPSLWSCRGIPTETARPRLALPHRTSIPHTHPGIKGHDCHDHSPSFLPLHRWA